MSRLHSSVSEWKMYLWRSASDSIGLTKVQQSLSLKKCLSCLRILFFCSTVSVTPFWFSSAFSRYSLEVILWPLLSTIWSEKSLKTHMKEGKKSAGSCSIFWFSDILMSLERFIMSEMLFRAVSSMLPCEL